MFQLHIFLWSLLYQNSDNIYNRIYWNNTFMFYGLVSQDGSSVKMPQLPYFNISLSTNNTLIYSICINVCICALQIGDLKDHYHFFHSRTIKRSTLSSRGRHSFISMEPKVSLWPALDLLCRHMSVVLSVDGLTGSVDSVETQWVSPDSVINLLFRVTAEDTPCVTQSRAGGSVY